MSNANFKTFIHGLQLKPLDSGPNAGNDTGLTKDGGIWVYQNLLKIYLDSSIRVVATLDQQQTFTNKILTDDSVYFGDSGDLTKKLEVELAGATTAKTMTVASSHTDDRTLTLPDATDTLVGKATTDTLTNKTLTSPI